MERIGRIGSSKGGRKKGGLVPVRSATSDPAQDSRARFFCPSTQGQEIMSRAYYYYEYLPQTPRRAAQRVRRNALFFFFGCFYLAPIPVGIGCRVFLVLFIRMLCLKHACFLHGYCAYAGAVEPVIIKALQFYSNYSAVETALDLGTVSKPGN